MKLISLLLIAYNNSQYIYETLDSIFRQDYSNIELVISDDGSEKFDLDGIKAYVEKNRSAGITNVVYNVNPENLGTCRHVEKIVPMCGGDIVGMIAADDAMSGTETLSAVASFFKENPSADVVCCNLEMCDENLINRDGKMFVAADDILKINEGDNRWLLGELACRCLLPALGTYYSRKALDHIYKNGRLARYNCVEDWTSAIILTREGFKFRFLDITGGKHRFGGVSHNKRAGYTEREKDYYADIMHIFDYEVEPYRELFPEDKYKLSSLRHHIRKMFYECASNYDARKEAYSKYRSFRPQESEAYNKPGSGGGKYIIVPMYDPDVLTSHYMNMLSMDTGGAKYVIALCDAKYERYWSERIINSIEDFYENNPGSRVTMSMICNHGRQDLNTFLTGAAERLGGKCVVMAPNDPRFTEAGIRGAFAKETDIVIQAAEAEKNLRRFDEESKAKKAAGADREPVFDISKYHLLGCASAAAAAAAVLLGKTTLSKELPFAEAFRSVSSLTMYWAAAVLLAATVLVYVIKAVSLTAGVLTNPARKEYIRVNVLNYLERRFTLGFLYQAFGMFFASGIMTGTGGTDPAGGLARQYLPTAFICCGAVLLLAGCMAAALDIMYRKYKKNKR